MLQPQVPLWPFTTLRAGGQADWFAEARTRDELAELASNIQQEGTPITTLGWGSNVLPSDDGVPGVVLHNSAKEIHIGADGDVFADTGCSFQELFLKTVQSSLRGLEFAVGIPGTLGGALVSNAGAYRSNVSEFLVELEVVVDGTRQWVEPSWMKFSYRNSLLREPNPPRATLVRVRMRLPKGDPRAAYDEARDYQRQRIMKQPPGASAGSFFKNVEDAELAAKLESLPTRLKEAGVVPAGYLIEHVGLAGHRIGGAMFSPRHANFIVNSGGASAFDIRRLAQKARSEVFESFGVRLEEEVMYLGDWSRFPR